jgi:membrane-associated phospholipid phosphatase
MFRIPMQTRSFLEALPRLLVACWRWKLLLTVLLGCVFWAGYSVLGHHAFFPLRTVPLVWLDRVIPYQPEPWGWVYLSQFSFTGTLPWLLSTKEGLIRYSTGFGLILVISFTVFLFFPVMGPRPEAAESDFSMHLIRGYDGVLNCFPSLHAAFLVYMGALAWRMFEPITPLWVILSCLAWGGAILYATLATKQHYALDLVAGALLGGVVDWLTWRNSGPGASADPTILRKKASKSQAGAR